MSEAAARGPLARPMEPLELDHVVLRVRDQDASCRFYTEVLGLEVDHVNEPIRLVHLRAGRHMVDLLPLESDATDDASRRMDHFCLAIRCDDLAALVTFLRARGVTVEGDAAARRGAFGTGPSIYVRDPDGYRIELKPR